ncbi:hypothetical protein B5E53_08325 [Eubacterium sp. An11]|nr:hypothetical protein B5E53_08325 [Eubacterium sp. An11]
MEDIRKLYKNSQKEFAPYQPYLEHNRNYKSYIPATNSLLSNIVWEVYQVDDFDDSKSLALPDLCADIMAFYTEERAYCYIMSASITMQQMKKLDFFSRVKSIFGIRMRTGMLGNIFRCDIKDVGNTQIALADAFWNGKEFEEKLAFADQFSDRWKIISDYLEKQFLLKKDENNIVLYIVDRIISGQGQVSVCELEEQTGYSGRYLRKIMKDNLGISIKQLCEVTQFQWMCNCYKKNKGEILLSDLALQAGYYDQSHMNRCCRKLTGKLPKNVIQMYA